MNKKVWVFVIVAIVVVLAIITLSNRGSAIYDDFATCVTESGAKMYGAYWCPHCKEQKEMFGKSWDKIDYTECSMPNNAGQTVECQISGIKSYPTWEFSDGKRLEGTIALEQLSQLTGCPLPS